MLENNVSVQPDGALTIRLLIPEAGKERTFRIVHLHDNSITNIEYEIDGDYAVFTVDKLSEFSFVIDNSASLWWLILILAIITALEITLILIKKWKNKKSNKMLSLALVSSVISIYEIVLLALFGVAVVALGVYVAYLYFPRGKKAVIADNAQADSTNTSENADISLSEPASTPSSIIPVTVKYNRSFTAKLMLAEDATNGYFVEIANYILSYKKTRCRIGCKNATFSYGRNTVSKLAIRGKILWICLALDPKEFVETKYYGEVFSENRRYQKVPYAFKIKSERGLKFAKELVDILMAKVGAIRGDENVVYAISDFPLDTQTNLIKRGLIKVYSDKEITDDSQILSAKFDIHSKVSVSDAKKLLDDTEAKSLFIKNEENSTR